MIIFRVNMSLPPVIYVISGFPHCNFFYLPPTKQKPIFFFKKSSFLFGLLGGKSKQIFFLQGGK